MTDLITRLSKLDAPDREVDWEIQQFFMGEWLQKNGYRREGDHYRTFTPPLSGTEICSGPEHYTASVDAAIALAERVLPGWTFEHIGQDYIRARGLENDVMPMGWTVEISDGSQTIQGQAPTFPLAICIALLRAKEASNA